MKTFLVIGLIVITLLVLLKAGRAVSSTSLEPQQVSRTVKRTSVMILPKDSHLKSDPAFSFDGTRAAAICSLGQKRVVITNNKEISLYEEVRDISFDQHNSLSFSGYRNGMWHFVTEGNESKGYESTVRLGALEGGQVIWWMAATGKSDTYKLFRNQDTVSESIRSVKVFISSERKQLAVTGFQDDKAVIFVDGVGRFSGNETNDFYFDDMQPYFHKDGTLRFVKIIFEDDSKALEFNGKKHSYYLSIGMPVVSPDGMQIAYSASKDPYKGFVMVRNGKEGQQHQIIKNPLFSPDSTKLAYIVQNKRSDLKSFNRDEKKLSYAVVMNDKKEQDYTGVYKITFSPDSSQLAYIASNNKGGRFIVINGREGKTYEKIFDLTFSPDSRHYAFRAKADTRWFIVVDGQEGESFHWVGVPAFSDDSQHLRYGARGGITLIKDEQGSIMSYPTFTESGESYTEFQVNEGGLTYAGHKNDEHLWTTTDAWIYTSCNEDELYWIDETVSSLPSGGIKKTNKPKTDIQVKFVDKALGAKLLPFSLSYAHPNVVTGKKNRVVIPALFTFVRNEPRAKSGVPVPRDKEKYSMVLQKFDLKETPISSNEMDLE